MSAAEANGAVQEGRFSLRMRFVLAAALAALPLVGLVTYASFDRYQSDRARAETRAETRAQIFATLLAEHPLDRAPTRRELAAAVALLPAVPGSATVVYRGRAPVLRTGDPGARPGSGEEAAGALAARSGTFHAAGPDGVQRVWGLARVDGGPYTVAFGLPGSAVYGTAQSALHRNLALAAAAALLALVAAFLLAGRVTRPVLQRSAELEVQNAALEAANDAKNDFLSRMSHELRTPLTAIIGFSELLALADLDEERRRWASMSLKASRHLLDLVNDVLDLARIEAGELQISPETVPLRPVLEEAMEMMEPLAAGYRVALHGATVPAGNGYVYADSQRLKQVLINLVSNAIKYNHDGGEVRVEVRPVSDERIRVSVQDTGNGLDEASIAKLFVPFERLDAARSGIDGTGLGLALSRSLVEGMGGSIDVESTPGRGSTFSIELIRREPVAASGPVDDPEDRLAIRRYGRRSVLLYIEDTAANVRLVEEILKRRPDVTVLPAMLGQLGIDLAGEHRPDLILLDLHLPDIDGAQVLDELQAGDRTRAIPVVILTADATKRNLDRLLAAGARDYLTKPIGVVQLLELADRYMEAPRDA